jgi:hypothetical protein
MRSASYSAGAAMQAERLTELAEPEETTETFERAH